MALTTNPTGIVLAEVLSHGAENTNEWIERQRIDQALSMITEVVQQHRGIVVSKLDDSILTTFVSADATIKAACAMQEAVLPQDLSGIGGEVTIRTTRAPIQLRVAVNFGKMMVAAGKYAGDAMDLTWLLVKEVEPGRILATEAVVKALRSDSVRQKMKATTACEIPDFGGPVEVYEVDWVSDSPVALKQVESANAAAPAPATVQAASNLYLHYQSTVTEVGPDNQIVTLGRSSENGIVIRSPHVSRKHAQVEYSDGQPELVNLSANGSCVLPDGQNAILCTSRLPLSGSGVIGLGPDMERAGDHLVRYTFDP